MADAKASRQYLALLLFGVIVGLVVSLLVLYNRDDARTPSPQPVVKGQGNAAQSGNQSKPNDNPPTPLKMIGQVRPFVMTNQHNAIITHTNFLGRPWLADIIFTRCPTFCPQMTQTLQQLRPKLPAEMQYATLTTDPKFDTPTELKKFAEQNGGNHPDWHYLTGTAAQIKALAIDDLKLTALPKPSEDQENENDLFIHSSYLMLIDRKGRVRNNWEYTEPDLLDKIRASLSTLEDEDDN